MARPDPAARYTPKERERFQAAFVLLGMAIGVLLLVAGVHYWRAAMEPYHGHVTTARIPLDESFPWLAAAGGLASTLVGVYAWYDSGTRWKGVAATGLAAVVIGAGLVALPTAG